MLSTFYQVDFTIWIMINKNRYYIIINYFISTLLELDIHNFVSGLCMSHHIQDFVVQHLCSFLILLLSYRSRSCIRSLSWSLSSYAWSYILVSSILLHVVYPRFGQSGKKNSKCNSIGWCHVMCLLSCFWLVIYDIQQLVAVVGSHMFSSNLNWSGCHLNWSI